MTRCVLWNDEDDELVFAGSWVEEDEDAETELANALCKVGKEELLEMYPVLEQSEED